MPRNPWLFLIHQLPPKPDYLRVKVRRRLQRVGAVALKNSVYVLPNRSETVEDFEWLLREIEGDGGAATLVEGSVLEGISDSDLEGLFKSEREGEYAEIATEAQKLKSARNREDPPAMAELTKEEARLRARLDEVAKLDFFRAPGRSSAESALKALERRVEAESEHQTSHRGAAMRGKTWVTRKGVFVDRMSSAWLIRRFIDPDAKFRFVDGREHKPSSDEVRFDMYHAEFTHEEEHCTFETLLKRFELNTDPALAAIGEIVHDIDIKDDKFGRPQTSGVRAILRGLAESSPDDIARLEASKAIFDGLYAELSDRSAAAQAE